MVDGITFLFQPPSNSSVSSVKKQETQPGILDLGADALTYNVARQVASSVFTLGFGGPFSDINSFLAVAHNQLNQQGSNKDFNPRDFELGSQKYGSAQDLFSKRETSAEARLRELLDNPPKVLETSPLPAASVEDDNGYFDLSIFDKFTSTTPPKINTNTAPTITVNTGTIVTEGATATITTAELTSTDAESPAQDITYKITQGPSDGYLAFSDDPATQITSFTQADLEAGRVTYIHEGGEIPSDSFSFSVSDGDISITNNTFNISITPVDDAPVLVTNTGGTVSSGGTTTLTTSQLNVTDVDTSSSNITYDISQERRGYLQLSTNPGTSINSFTQDDLEAGRVQFVNTNGRRGQDAIFNFTVSDGTTSLGRESFTFAIV